MIRLILAFLIALIVGLVIFLPVRTVYGWVAPTDAPVSVHGVSGTLLSAQVDQVRYGNLSVAEDIDWTWQPLRLVLLRLSGSVVADVARGPVRAEVAATPWGSVQVDDLTGRFSIADILGVAGMSGIGVDGGAELDIAQLRMAGERLTTVTGQVRVRDLGWTFGPKRYLLGDFSADVTLEDEQLVGVLGDAGGPVALEGTFRLDPVGRNWTLDGRIKMRSDADPVLGNLVQGSLGRPDSAGWYRLSRRGQL